jgi:hypothetical protein
MTSEDLTPAQLAVFNQSWQAINHTLDNLMSSYRQMTGDGEVSREADLLLFASALPDTVSTDGLGMLLACAIARLATGTEERPKWKPVAGLRNDRAYDEPEPAAGTEEGRHGQMAR